MTAGRILHGRTLHGEVTRDADVVVCGSGAGGSMAARELSRAGLEVLLLEEGGDHRPPDFTQREDEMIPLLFQQHGGRRSDDLSMLILSGRGLGGSTVHNTNLCKRIPKVILEHWERDLGVHGVGPEAMAPLFEEVERDLGVVDIPDERVNTHNALMRAGIERLGWRGSKLRHNRDGRCVASGFCEVGCAYDGKLNARRVVIPAAVGAGATVMSDARVERVRHRRGRVSGVEASLLDGAGGLRGTLTVRARAVCLAGSAIGSAAIALRSGLPDPHLQIGRRLHVHPGAVVAGVFRDPVRAWQGVPQSWDCTEWLDPRPGADRRVWLVPSFAHPVGTASMMPGFGPELMGSMRRYPHLAAIAAMVHDETPGRVYVASGRSRIAYAPNAADREQLARGARAAGRILLAAGATEVMVPALPPIRARRERDLDAITADRFRPHDGRLTAVHPMGTLPMGADPRRSAVDPRGAYHGMEGLWVVDGSLFPTSIGGPPRISIFTFAMKVARTLASALAH